MGGGGTDLPSFYSRFGGFVISAAIDHHVYVTVNRNGGAGGNRHPIVREVLKLLNAQDQGLEITSRSDIPAGMGLGSSGSFTTAVIKAVLEFQRRTVQREELAELACQVELDLLREPIGKQDQYSAAFGGLTCFELARDGKVTAVPLAISGGTRAKLEAGLQLFSLGYPRQASTILEDQDRRCRSNDAEMFENLHCIMNLGRKSRTALESGDLRDFGELMHEHWLWKKKRSSLITNAQIDRLYSAGMAAGALGGKVVGAGGSGFLMFYTEDPPRLCSEMAGAGLEPLRFGFEFEGTNIL